MATIISSPVFRALTELQALAENTHQPVVARDLEQLLERLRLHEVRLAVAGCCEQGKSTVINALVGAPVLPTDPLPLPPLLTFVRTGESPSISIAFEDGTIEAVNLACLTEYAAENHQGPPPGVRHLEVTVPPGSLLDPNLCLIDLPEVGWLRGTNPTVVLNVIDTLDAVIFVTGDEPLITEAERCYLAEIARRVPRVFVVHNKPGRSGPQDAWVTAFTATVIEDLLGPVDIVAVSAKDALAGKLMGDTDRVRDAGWPALESQLVHFLEESRTPLCRTAILAHVMAAVGPVLQSLTVRRATLEMPQDRLRRQVALLDARSRDLQRIRDDAAVKLRRNVEWELCHMAHRLKNWAYTCIRDVEQELAAAVAGGVVGKGVMDTAVAASMALVTMQEIHRWEAWWHTHIRDLDVRGVELLTQIQWAYEQALGVQFEFPETLMFPPVTLTTGWTGFEYENVEPQQVWNGLVSLLPSGLRRVLEVRRLRKQLPEVVDRFRGQVRRAITEAVEKVLLEVLSQFDAQITGLDFRLRTALDQALLDLESSEISMSELRMQVLWTERTWRNRLADLEATLERWTDEADTFT